MNNRAPAFWRAAFFSFLGLLLLQATAATLAEEGKSDAGTSGSLAGAMPPGAVGYAEAAGLGQLLGRIQGSSYLETLKASPQFQGLQKSPQYAKAEAVRKIVETQLGMDIWKAVEALLSDRVAVAIYPKAEGPAEGKAMGKGQNVVAILRGADPKVLAQFRERLEPFLTLMNDQAAGAETIHGAKVVSFNGKAFVALGDSWIAAASTRELLVKALGLLAGKEQGSLAADEPFRAMAGQMGGEHLVRGYVNTALLTKAKGSRLTPEKLDNPLASMLLGGFVEMTAGSPYAGLTLDVNDDRFLLTTGIAGDSRKLDAAHRVFFSDPDGPGTPAIPQVPALIGGFTFHLDLANWYKQREKLLEASVLPGFDKFETGIGNLLPGKDVGEDLVPLIGKNLTFVAAPQDYSHLEGRPGFKLPGFALVIDLAKPEEGADIFQLFFQTFSAILNTQAGQQGRQPWVMTSETFKDVQISYGRYLKKPAGDQLPVVFNFMPASARVGDKFVISSSLGLCRQLVEDLQKPVVEKQHPNRNLNFELYPDPLANVLEANKSVFQARAIQEGKDAKQAEGEFSTAIQLLRFFNSFRLSTTVKPDAVQAQFEGSWK